MKTNQQTLMSHEKIMTEAMADMIQNAQKFSFRYKFKEKFKLKTTCNYDNTSRSTPIENDQ